MVKWEKLSKTVWCNFFLREKNQNYHLITCAKNSKLSEEVDGRNSGKFYLFFEARDKTKKPNENEKRNP
jgi:hypothetical protein